MQVKRKTSQAKSSESRWRKSSSWTQETRRRTKSERNWREKIEGCRGEEAAAHRSRKKETSYDVGSKRTTQKQNYESCNQEESYGGMCISSILQKVK